MYCLDGGSQEPIKLSSGLVKNMDADFRRSYLTGSRTVSLISRTAR